MIKNAIVKAMVDLDEDLVVEEVRKQLAADITVTEVAIQLQQGMEWIERIYKAGGYFLSEWIMSAHILATAAEILKSTPTTGKDPNGVVVLGSVKGDIHDIGKNIVATYLSCHGLKVVDIGVDAPISDFVKAVKNNNPQVVGVCCLLTASLEALKETVAAVKVADPSVLILVGGSPVDEHVAQYCGADGYCKNAYDAVEMTKEKCLLTCHTDNRSNTSESRRNDQTGHAEKAC